MLDSFQLNETVHAALTSNADAFLAIVRALDFRCAFLSSKIFHLDDVDDVGQETFIAAYRSLNMFRRGKDFGAWLRGSRARRRDRWKPSSGSYSPARRRAGRGCSRGRFRAPPANAYLHAKLPERMRHVRRSMLDGSKSSALAEELEATPGAIFSGNTGLWEYCANASHGSSRMETDLQDALIAWQGDELPPGRADTLLARLRDDTDFPRAFIAEV